MYSKSMKTALARAEAHVNGARRLAELLNIDVSNVYHWRRLGVPPARQIEIEKITNGVVRAIDFLEEK